MRERKRDDSNRFFFQYAQTKKYKAETNEKFRNKTRLNDGIIKVNFLSIEERWLSVCVSMECGAQKGTNNI